MLPYVYLVPYRDDKAVTASLATWCCGGGDTERRKMRWGRLGAGCRKRFHTNAMGKNNARKVEFLEVMAFELFQTPQSISFHKV